MEHIDYRPNCPARCRPPQNQLENLVCRNIIQTAAGVKGRVFGGAAGSSGDPARVPRVRAAAVSSYSA